MTIDRRSLLLAGTAVGPTVPGALPAALPAVTGEEPDVSWAWTPLDGPGVLLTALGSVRGVARVLDAAPRG